MILRLLLAYPLAVARAASERAWLAVQPLTPTTEHDEPIGYALTDMASIFSADDVQRLHAQFVREQGGAS